MVDRVSVKDSPSNKILLNISSYNASTPILTLPADLTFLALAYSLTPHAFFLIQIIDMVLTTLK